MSAEKVRARVTPLCYDRSGYILSGGVSTRSIAVVPNLFAARPIIPHGLWLRNSGRTNRYWVHALDTFPSHCYYRSRSGTRSYWRRFLSAHSSGRRCRLWTSSPFTSASISARWGRSHWARGPSTGGCQYCPSGALHRSRGRTASAGRSYALPAGSITRHGFCCCIKCYEGWDDGRLLQEA